MHLINDIIITYSPSSKAAVHVPELSGSYANGQSMHSKNYPSEPFTTVGGGCTKDVPEGSSLQGRLGQRGVSPDRMQGTKPKHRRRKAAHPSLNWRGRAGEKARDE